MQVGDLVKDKTAVPLFGFGIITHPELGGWWVYWSCGAWGFYMQTELEVVCK